MAVDLRHSAIVSFGVHAGAESSPVVVIVVVVVVVVVVEVVVVEGLVVVLVLVPVVKGRFPTIVADLRYSAIVSLAGSDLSEWPMPPERLTTHAAVALRLIKLV